MAPATTQEEPGEASGSDGRRPGEAPPAPPSLSGERRAGAERSESPTSTPAELETHTASPASSDSETSSAASSPLRWPYLPRTVIGEDASGRKILEPYMKMDPLLVDTYEELKLKYREKRDRQLKLVTLRPHIQGSCFVNQELLPVRESATKTVLEVAKTVMILSSYVDGRLLAQCSGFLINWYYDSKIATLLTSAHIILSNSPSDEWLGIDEYIPGAEVHVHLLDKDDTVVVAHLLHYDKHFNLAMFKIEIDFSAEISSFSAELKFGQSVFVLGRDKNQQLSIGHGQVQFVGPSEFERHHYMFLNCEFSECGLGGVVIDFNGDVVGMVNSRRMGFIPSSFIVRCLHMWKKFNCIPRFHTGMKFEAIKFLDPVKIEEIYRKCNIAEGLIVLQVSEGSAAEKLGIRNGDIVQWLNGVCVATTTALEKLILQICEEHIDKGNDIGSTVEVSVGIFHTRKGCGCTKRLTLKVSDDVEVIARGIHPVSVGMFND